MEMIPPLSQKGNRPVGNVGVVESLGWDGLGSGSEQLAVAFATTDTTENYIVKHMYIGWALQPQAIFRVLTLVLM